MCICMGGLSDTFALGMQELAKTLWTQKSGPVQPSGRWWGVAHNQISHELDKREKEIIAQRHAAQWEGQMIAE